MTNKEGWRTAGLIPGRYPKPENYDLSYFEGQKVGNISYPTNATYLNPNSEYSRKFNDILGWIKLYLGEGVVLDVGSGPSHLSTWAKRNNSQSRIVNFDISHEILSWAHRYLQTENSINGAGFKMPFASDAFDAVLLSDVLEHMWPFDAQKSVRETFRVLKSGGRIFINIPNRITWDDTTFKITDHVWIPTIPEIRQLLEQEHFDPESIHHYTRGFPFSKKWHDRTGNDFKFPIFGRSIFLTAKK